MFSGQEEEEDCHKGFWTAGTHVYLVEAVPAREVVQDPWLVEVRQLRHVVHSRRRRLRVLGVYATKARHNLKPIAPILLHVKQWKPITMNIDIISQ